MISSNECWMKDSCIKYLKKDAECKYDDIFCIKLFKLDQLYNNSLFTDQQKQNKKLYAEIDDEDAFLRIYNECKNSKVNIPKGENIYLWSITSGNGKTSMSEKLCRSYLQSIWAGADLEAKVLFINTMRYLSAMKENFNENNEYYQYIKDNVLKADLVVWDDLATKGLSEYEREQLLYTIDSRITSGKSNIFTVNIDPNEVAEVIGSRLASRVAKCSTVIQLVGEDKRGMF